VYISVCYYEESLCVRGLSCFAQSSANPWAAFNETLGYWPVIFSFPQRNYFWRAILLCIEELVACCPPVCHVLISVSREGPVHFAGGARGGGFQGKCRAPGPGVRFFTALFNPLWGKRGWACVYFRYRGHSSCPVNFLKRLYHVVLVLASSSETACLTHSAIKAHEASKSAEIAESRPERRVAS